jgi:hypothetical protein
MLRVSIPRYPLSTEAVDKFVDENPTAGLFFGINHPGVLLVKFSP